MKVSLSSLEMTKANIDTGSTKDWGVYAGGGEGYAIGEGSETEIYESALRFAPYFSFEVIPVIPFGQHYETFKKRAAAR